MPDIKKVLRTEGFRYLALLLAAGVLLAELSGLRAPASSVALAGLLFSAGLLRKLAQRPLWQQVVRYSGFFVLLAMLGFCYTARELPGMAVPFAALAGNPVTPLDVHDFPQLPIAGLPAAASVAPAAASSVATTAGVAVESTVGNSSLQALIAHDSVIRDTLVALQEKQDRDYADELARLHSLSVADTGMRRDGLSRATVSELYREHAISGTKYRTYTETWKLLGKDVEAFKRKQADERFRALVGLLENEQINESDKIAFIHYMARTYGNDVRLVRPLLNVYARLDNDYPRQKRRNQEFLNLYLQKREALLTALKAIGTPACQPLLDFRRKTIAQMSYSQARLDKFLQENFGNQEQRVRPLYKLATPIAVPAFLNRQKYPSLGRLQGPSYTQEYLRLNAVQMAAANSVPAAGMPIAGLAAERYAELRRAFSNGYPADLDRWVIDADDAVRINMAWLLAEHKDPLLLPIVLDLLQDPHPEVRRLSAIALGNFSLVDAQGANDPKFIALITMLQNYRSNSDSHARAWAVLGLANTGDRSKALFVIDLILNNGKDSNSLLGEAAPTWRSDEERAAIGALIKTLKETPESIYLKTQALNALLAIDSPETIGVLLHYLQRTYAHYGVQPGIWRTIVPHLSLPQEAENVEDILRYMAVRHGASEPAYQRRNLEALELQLEAAYQNHRSGEYFQLLSFLQNFDAQTYANYVQSHLEHIRLMRTLEYARCTGRPWIYGWLLSMVVVLGVLRLRNTSEEARVSFFSDTGRRANPATGGPVRQKPPSAALLPIRVVKHG